MKNIYLLGYVIICMIISGCEKQATMPKITMQSDYFADSAIGYLKNRLTPEEFFALNTNSPNVIKYNGESKAVRIFSKDSTTKKFILLYLKNDKFTGHWVDLSHLIKSSLNKYDGTVSLFDLQNKLTTKYTISSNNVTDMYDGTQGSTIDIDDRSRTSTSTPDNPEWLDAFVVTPKPLTAIPDYYSAYWLLNRDEELKSYFIPDYNYTGGGVASSNMEAAITFPSPDHPIENIKEELKCFTIDNKAVYSVTVNVNQPEPDTRNLVNLGSKHQVGHAYLTLQEQMSNGDIIIRNIGFYPMHNAKPGSENEQSIYGDDSQTPYSVSLKLSVSASEFGDIQATIYSKQTQRYDLEDFNCTSAVINTFNSVNINLPSTIGHNVGFDGMNPADLGQDIRQLDLSSFSANNGNRKVVRNTRSKNDAIPPSRSGNCK